MSTNVLTPSAPATETRLDLDGYRVMDSQSRQVRFTRKGRDALSGRFARAGVDLRRVRTLDEVEQAICDVTGWEYRRLSPAQREDEATVAGINDLHFITDGITGQPLRPRSARRQRLQAAEQKLLDLLGITV